MRIAIVSLPLHTNYGGILQAYALKTCLESAGHDVTVIDRKDKMPVPSGLRAPFVYAKRALKRLLKGSSGPEVFRELRYRREFPVIASNTNVFVENRISPRVVRWYDDIKEGEYDAFVVGSDQVWRPLYFGRIEDAFLAFTRNWDVKRLAYAASFGTDQLEYEYMQLEECSRLLAEFDAVSVREDVGVRMCSEWLDCETAVHVADPVFLLDRTAYEELASVVSESPTKGRIMTYVLDKNSQKNHVIDFVKRVSGMDVEEFAVRPDDPSVPVEDRVAPSLENWIASFRDASFVITDSFHGCVMSVIFHKPFIAVGNSMRGMSRLQSLLSGFDLDLRLVQGIDPEDDGEFFMSSPDWEKVDEKLSEMKGKSYDFLMNGLK